MAVDRIERMEQLFRGHGRIAHRGKMYVVSIVIDALRRYAYTFANRRDKCLVSDDTDNLDGNIDLEQR